MLMISLNKSLWNKFINGTKNFQEEILKNGLKYLDIGN